MELVLIVANAKGREIFLCHDRIQSILALAILATCLLTHACADTLLLDTVLYQGPVWGAMAPHPQRSIPTRPMTHAPATPHFSDTPPRRLPTRPFHWAQPTLGQIPAYSIPYRSLRIAELCGGDRPGSLLSAGYAVASYTWTNTDPDAQAAGSHRLTRLRATYPHLFPVGATPNWASTLSMDIISISLDVFEATLHEEVNITFASPPRRTRHHPDPDRENMPQALDATQLLAHLILHLIVTQSGVVGFFWSIT